MAQKSRVSRSIKNVRLASRSKLKKEIKALERDAPKQVYGPTRQATARTTRSWCMNLVAQLHLLGTYGSEDIAQYLNERHGIELKSVTIRKYIAQMRKKWQEQAMADTNTMITQELAKIQQIEEYAIGALRDGSLRVADNGAFVQLGDSKDFCDIMLKISKRRSTLMGLDKAQKIEFTDGRVSELSDDELETILKAARKTKPAA